MYKQSSLHIPVCLCTASKESERLLDYLEPVDASPPVKSSSLLLGTLLLSRLLLIDASSANAIGALAFLVAHDLVVIFGTMQLLFKDGIGFDGLEFGLEVANGVAVGAAVGATTGVGEVVIVVLGLVAGTAPDTS